MDLSEITKPTTVESFSKAMLLIGLATLVMSVVAIVIAIVIWQFPVTNTFSSLKYGLVSYVEKINLDGGEDLGNIKVFFNDNEINNLTYAKYRFINNGSSPIAPEDYIKNLQIIVPDSTTILKFNIKPANIMTGTLSDNTITFDAKLLNPGDYFDVEISASGKFNPEEASLIGRVVGLSNYSYTIFDKEDFLSVSEKRDVARKNLVELIILLASFIAVMVTLSIILFFLSLLKINEKRKTQLTFIFSILWFGSLVGYFLYGLTDEIWNAFFI